jgi:hypothetical protein
MATYLVDRGRAVVEPPRQPVRRVNRSAGLAVGLAGLWPLIGDGYSPIAGDVSTLVGTATYAGVPGLRGVQIGASASYALAASWPSAPRAMNDPMSIAVWFATTQATNFCLIGARGGGSDLYIGSQSATSLLIYGGGVIVNPTITSPRDGAPHCLLITNTGVDVAGSWTVYLDGRSVGTGNRASNNAVFGTDVRFGYDQGGTGDTLNGAMGHVAVWNRVLSATEAWALYDPQTRWDLYAQQPTRVFFDVTGGGGGTTARLMFRRPARFVTRSF